MPYSWVVIQVRYLLTQSCRPAALERCEHTVAPQDGGGADDFDEVDRIDDADAPPGDAPLDRLRVAQVRVHERGFVGEPRAEVPRRMLRVRTFLRQQPRRGQRRDVNAQSHQRLAVRNEVLRVRQAVTLNVWAFRIGGIRPPVITFGKEIMPAAGAARAHDGRDRDRRLPEVARGGPQHTGLFQGPEISGLSDCAGKEQAGGRDKKRPAAQFT